MRHMIRLLEVSFDVATLAQFVLDTGGNLVNANARARAMFAIRPEDIGRPFRDLELSYRPVELQSLIERAYGDGLAAQVRDVPYHRAELDQYFDVDVVPLTENGVTLLGVSITFHDVTHAHLVRDELERSRQDLETAYEELQSRNEELETTNQALQSTVEELVTINEKLQSTNEELQTVNGELRERTE